MFKQNIIDITISLLINLKLEEKNENKRRKMYKTFLSGIFFANDRLLYGDDIAGICQLFCGKCIGVILPAGRQSDISVQAV